jgi:hypothetical protein
MSAFVWDKIVSEPNVKSHSFAVLIILSLLIILSILFAALSFSGPPYLVYLYDASGVNLRA